MNDKFLARKIMGVLVVSSWIGFLCLIQACKPTAQQQTLQQTRVQLLPELKSGRTDDKILAEIYQQALSTGLGLGYRVGFADASQGVVSFAKELSPEHVPVTINLHLQREGEQSLYAEITLQSPRNLEDTLLKDFEKTFLSKIKKKIEAPIQPSAPPTAKETPPPAQPPIPAQPQAAGEAKPEAAEKAIPSHLFTAKNARIRSQPNPNSKILMTISAGRKLETAGRDGDWYKVKLSSAEIGWVFKGVVKETP